MTYLTLIAGLILLLGGAEVMVRGAVTLARKLEISPMVIGLTVVAMGTSAPELIVAVEAALEGAAGIAVGNVVGSNIANILLILGVSGLIYPIASNPKAMKRDGSMLGIMTLLFALICWQGVVGFWSGTILLVLFLIFIGHSYWREAHAEDPEAAELHAKEAAEFEDVKGGVPVALVATIGGIAILILGSDFLVKSGIELARQWGVSEEVIGLTMIALGTSLPELAASAVAAYRRHTDVALGNVVGSNLFNMLAVMGAAALVAPLPVAKQILQFDLWVMLFATLLLVAFALTRQMLSRLEAGLLFIIYLAYIGLQAKGVESLL